MAGRAAARGRAAAARAAPAPLPPARGLGLCCGLPPQKRRVAGSDLLRFVPAEGDFSKKILVILKIKFFFNFLGFFFFVVLCFGFFFFFF